MDLGNRYEEVYHAAGYVGAASRGASVEDEAAVTEPQSL